MSTPVDPADLIARDLAVAWHPYAPVPMTLPPVPVAGAEGAELVLADGRRVVDGMSSWWAAIHGYRHPVLDAAVRDQLDRMSHVMFGGLTHSPAVELCEQLVEIAPDGLTRVFLADSGSVAVEVALKMAIQHWHGRGQPQRTRLLTVRGGYHGDTLGAMSVCDPVTGMHGLFAGVLPEQLFAPMPQPAFGEAFDRSHVAELERLAVDHADEVAAIILEPIVQGAGGMRVYAPEYLAEVRRICDRTGALLILDEIATGFGRTGRLFAAEHAGVRPDVMCVGKAMTGGYLTMAATLCTDAVAAGVSAAASGALMHGPTFMANPLGAAVSLASIRLLLEQDWQAEVGRIEGRLRDGLAPARDLPGVTDVRVLGAIGVVETTEALPMAALQDVFLSHGVWLRPFGRLVYTMPPYVTSDAQLDRVTAAMVDAVTRVQPES